MIRVARTVSGLRLALVTGATAVSLAAHVQPSTVDRIVSNTVFEADAGSLAAFASADGRFVAFYSWATNLVAGETNHRADAFVRDRQTGELSRESLSVMGGEGDDSSFNPSISGDGRVVAFVSAASNLVPDDANDFADVFVRQRLP